MILDEIVIFRPVFILICHFIILLYNRMTKEERIFALRALAKKHPYAENVGYMWKNPLNPRSKGIRWSTQDLKLFRKFQIEYR